MDCSAFFLHQLSLIVVLWFVSYNKFYDCFHHLFINTSIVVLWLVCNQCLYCTTDTHLVVVQRVIYMKKLLTLNIRVYASLSMNYLPC